MKNRFLAAMFAALLLAPVAANAALVQIYYDSGSSGVDAAFEGIGGWLQTTYGLTPSVESPNTVLPQLEVAVAQLAANNANGLHLPTPATGIPGVGDGVVRPLTNFPPMGNGTNGGDTVSGTLANFVSGVARAVDFIFARTGDVITYHADGRIWTSASQDYFRDLNALEFRLRSTSGNTESLTNLKFNDSVTVNQSLADISAANGDVTIALFSAVATGDFTLTGTFNYTGTGTGWNHQIKGLSLPPPIDVPVPSTLALFAVGMLAIGGNLRRRRTG